jgi:hypothetical protein
MASRIIALAPGRFVCTLLRGWSGDALAEQDEQLWLGSLTGPYCIRWKGRPWTNLQRGDVLFERDEAPNKHHSTSNACLMVGLFPEFLRNGLHRAKRAAILLGCASQQANGLPDIYDLSLARLQQDAELPDRAMERDIYDQGYCTPWRVFPTIIPLTVIIWDTICPCPIPRKTGWWIFLNRYPSRLAS